MFEDRPLGSLTIAEIDSVDLAGMSADALLELSLLARSLAAAADAVAMKVEAAFDRTYVGDIGCTSLSEHGLASRFSDTESGTDLFRARLYDTHLLPVREAMQAGELSRRHGEAILRAVRCVIGNSDGVSPQDDELNRASEQVVAELMAAIVDYAKTHTVKQTADTVRRWLKVKDPLSAEQRRERAMARRGVSFEVTADGLGQLLIEGNPTFLYMIYLAICAAGDFDKSHAEAGDTRTRANFRADAVIGALYSAIQAAQPDSIEDTFRHLQQQMLRAEIRGAVLGEPLLATVRPFETGPWHWNRNQQLRRLIYDDEGQAAYLTGAKPPNPDAGMTTSHATNPDRGETHSHGDPPMLPRQRTIEWGSPLRGKLRRTGVSPIRISVVMDDATLQRRANNPAIVDGQFDLTADAARELLRCADFQRMLVDRNTGHFIEKSEYIYEPSRELREIINTQHVTCQKPTCTTPAHLCDFDHRVPFNHHNPTAGGLTTKDNGGPLCRPDHLKKTAKLFDIQKVPGGELYYLTPLGRRYIIELADHRPGSAPFAAAEEEP